MKLPKLSYIFFAGIATAFEWTSFYILNTTFHYILAAIVSLTIGCILNYSLNKVFTFKDKDKKIARQFTKFLIVASAYYILTILFMYILVTLLYTSPMVSKIITTLLLLIFSYNAHRAFTFKVHNI